MNILKKTFAAVTLLMSIAQTHAGIVTNDTDLLGGTDHQLLSSMFGQDINLTRIFAKQVGNTAQDWHAAVDGQGSTFSVIEIANAGMGNMRIGGYNGTSWDSGSGWGVDATNFLFNLDTGVKYLQERTNGTSRSTLNNANYGPTFGGGHDLYVNTNLSGGYVNIGYSYGEVSRYSTFNYRNEFAGSHSSWSIVGLETFTLSSSTGDFGTGAVSSIYTAGNAVANVSINGLPVVLSLGVFALMGGLTGFRRKVIQ